jgi:hypothetical protein
MLLTHVDKAVLFGCNTLARDTRAALTAARKAQVKVQMTAELINLIIFHHHIVVALNCVMLQTMP